LFFRLTCGFSFARKLSWRLSSYRRKLPVFAPKPHRPLASLQLSSPGRKRVSSPANFCNLLQKTGCKSRQELVKKYNPMLYPRISAGHFSGGMQEKRMQK